MHVHCHTCGSMEIPKPLPSSSVSVASLFLEVYHAPTPSELLPFNFVAFHAATHIYNVACILSFTVCTCNACTYHEHRISPFIIHAHVALVHIITYSTHA